MDSTKLIRDKREQLRALHNSEGIDVVLRHLEVAQRHFERGRAEGESDSFTDVVYRTNQVFEGILKEAYVVLTGRDGSRKTPDSIEKYLTTNDVFTKRVIDYFTRYRQEWRNPSTHNHRLDFNEQEAFLAISSVAAFCYVAIDQIVQELVARTVERRSIGAAKVDFLVSADLAQMLSVSLPQILKNIEVNSDDHRLSEYVVVGAIQGLLRSTVEGVDVLLQPAFTVGEFDLRPDIILGNDDSRVIIEIARLPPNQIALLKRGTGLLEHVSKFVRAGNADYGLAIVLPSKLSAANIPEFTFYESEFDGFRVTVIHPKVDTATN